MCWDVTAVIVKYYQLLHARTRESPTLTLPWKATHFTSSPLEIAVTFLGSVLGSRGTGKSPIRRHGTGRACTDYDSRWLTHSFGSHTSFPCHDQPRLSGTVEKQGGNHDLNIYWLLSDETYKSSHSLHKVVPKVPKLCRKFIN